MKKLFLICLAVLSISIQPAYAAGKLTAPPDGLLPSLENLLAAAHRESAVKPDMNDLRRILEFMETPKNLGNAFSLGKQKETASDYYEFMIERPWDQVVDLVYNPDIPSFITGPSSVRMSYWLEVDGRPQPFPKLPTRLEDLQTPVIINGLEFIENSPDTNTGAYYSYNLERTLILFTLDGRRVLVSISVQPDKSQVGKKGVVIGSDEDWNYLYTGQKGCTLPGLGWADTYMYDSESIMVYYETKTPQKTVQCATFKWLNAGWSGMNFVKSKHIRKGVERFARDFKSIIESPSLPDNMTLAKAFKKIEDLPTDALKAKSSAYFAQLKERYTGQDSRSDKWLSKLSNDRSYVENMSRDEMQALISIEYLKYLLGKPDRFDTEYFANFGIEQKPS